MCCQETLNSDEWEDSNGESVEYGVTVSTFIPNIWEGETPVPGGLLQALLGGYSQRKLSYDADMINAIQGVFSTLEVRHCWGMPFECLSGRTEVTLALNRHGGLRGEETDFPSWSWACNKLQRKKFWRPSMSSQSLRVEVTPADGTWIDVHTYYSSYGIQNDHKLGRLLRVTGYVSRPLFVEGAWFPEMSTSKLEGPCQLDSCLFGLSGCLYRPSSYFNRLESSSNL
jgi:hypothetical protein